jgi:hypothetical protein
MALHVAEHNLPRDFLPEGGRKIAQDKRSAVLGTRFSTRLEPWKGDVNSQDAFNLYFSTFPAVANPCSPVRSFLSFPVTIESI